MPQTPHVEKHFTASETVRDIVIGSGKVAIVGHMPQRSGEILDLGYLMCIDRFCHGGGWLTALEVESGRRVWQVNEAGELRD